MAAGYIVELALDSSVDPIEPTVESAQSYMYEREPSINCSYGFAADPDSLAWRLRMVPV